MKISFHGAARTVTGSKHIIHLNNDRQILLDCGLFQGLGKETDALNEHFGFNPNKIDLVLLSHAHIDHSGLLPRLVKQGYKGKIISTQATKDLTEILLYDSAEIQTYEAEHINKRRGAKGLPAYEPLYTAEDVAQTMALFETIEYDEWFPVMKDVAVCFTNTGHLIGSAAITLRIKEAGKQQTILFSGDVGRYRSMLLFPGLKYIQSVEDSKKLVDYQEPCVIISASGTADAGRVRHHINDCIGNEKNAILFVGYCGIKSLGGQLLNGEKQVEIFADACNVVAEIGQMQGLSAHGDMDDLVRFISNQDPEKVKKIFLVHGEPDTQKAFANRLQSKGFANIEIPEQHHRYDLSKREAIQKG